MDIVCHRARIDDAEDLVRVQVAAFHYDSVIYPTIEIGGPPGYDSVQAMSAKIQQDECYKIVHAGECVGGIVVFDKGQGHYHLDVIFIDPAHQNHGIGTQAMQFIEQTYPASLWTLDTPMWAVRNHHFYEKMGYVRVGEHHDGDTPLFMYEKRAP